MGVQPRRCRHPHASAANAAAEQREKETVPRQPDTQSHARQTRVRSITSSSDAQVWTKATQRLRGSEGGASRRGGRRARATHAQDGPTAQASRRKTLRHAYATPILHGGLRNCSATSPRIPTAPFPLATPLQEIERHCLSAEAPHSPFHLGRANSVPPAAARPIPGRRGHANESKCPHSGPDARAGARHARYYVAGTRHGAVRPQPSRALP